MVTVRKLSLRLTCLLFEIGFLALVCGVALGQQQPSMPGMQMEHQHSEMAQPHQLEFPQLGRDQNRTSGSVFTLEGALGAARKTNPTYRQAEAGIQAARARAHQAALYPNPSIGYAGDEIRGGSSQGGKQGFFVEQTIVTGGKLSRAQDFFSKETKLAEIETEEQKIRVETAVKMAFYRVLAAQEMAGSRADLARIAGETFETQRQLHNTGQADETELFAAQLDAERAKLAARQMENTLREEWRTLAAVLGTPDLPLQTVSGDLEHDWPQLEEVQVIETIATRSPASRIASTGADRAFAQLARAQREKIPDIVARAGVDYNHEPLDNPRLATGWEWNAQLAMSVPLFNRNQGNVAAARADIERASAEKQRVNLTLRERASSAFDEYLNARLTADEYRERILPLAKKSYGLMFDRYSEMLAAYPRVLESKRKLFELQSEYIMALESVWTSGVALEGFLLTDGLEAPTEPGEMGRTIRETNLPTPERTRLP
jgi:cobalt-zinc-cadmium efflux system outer membrane protein